MYACYGYSINKEHDYILIRSVCKMKKLVGTFRTEEEAILAINDLKDMGLEPKEITIMTNDPMEFKTIESSFGQGAQGMVGVGHIAHGPGVNSFITNLPHYGFHKDTAKLHKDNLSEGHIFVFIGVAEELQHHLDNPGTYQAKDFHIDGIETPGTYTLTDRRQDAPDTPGKYVAEEYGNNPETPGTYEDPVQGEGILTPGTLTEEDELKPHHNMVKNDDHKGIK